MNLFYHPHALLAGKIVELQEAEAQHAVQVLRMKSGDVIHLFDGRGLLCQGEILFVSKKNCAVKIGQVVKEEKPPKHRLTIAVSPTKLPSRTEWMVEKLVELGVDTIQFVAYKHTEKNRINEERLNKIVLSAAKQSQRLILTEVKQTVSFHECLLEANERFIIAKADSESSMPDVLRENQHSSTTIFIGPEGDFSDEEMRVAIERKAVFASLGKTRLRVETAAVAAAAVYSIR